MSYATDEKMLFEELVSIMRRCVCVCLCVSVCLCVPPFDSVLSVSLGASRFDPDILVGYEIQMRSWGYLLQRAAVLGVDLCQQMSRVPGKCHSYAQPTHAPTRCLPCS